MADFLIIIKRKSRIDHLFKIRNSKLIQYKSLTIPKLQPLTQNQVLELQTQMAFDKAISYDCIIHQMIKNCQRKLLMDI
ncbi:unnamed protein product [Paramecium primaurelia]|uniref:Uncharacterized protein n=1 Tax=Paramecium primaurelia TaxID=5886 RepID=A0A8S1QCB1_PARPR|nr:unnamed protein product [Paramecium primaurelia]